YLCSLMLASRVWLHRIIFIGLALTWGSSFILMKRGLDVFSSDQVAALRIFIAFLFFLPICLPHLRAALRANFVGIAGMGIFGNLIPAFLFTYAETMIASSLTGMLNALTPLFTLVTGLILFRQPFKQLQFIGVVVALAGAVGLLSQLKDEGVNSNIWLGGSMVILATVFYGLSVNIIREKLSKVNAVTATVCAMCVIGPPAGIYLFSTDFLDRLFAHPEAMASLGYICILAIFGTALSVIVFNVLIREAGAMYAASVTYFIPMVAMIWGIVDGESVGWLHALCIGVILVGVWLVNRGK
ncbi:MAG: DMT family transporter, partial [Bacteroidia bacterium]